MQFVVRRRGGFVCGAVHSRANSAIQPASLFALSLASRRGVSSRDHESFSLRLSFSERGGKSLATFPGALDHPHWAEGLARLVKDGRLRKIEIARIDGAPSAESPAADHLLHAGFVVGYRGLLLRS